MVETMSDFETKAKELLEIADKFRNEIKSKTEIKIIIRLFNVKKKVEKISTSN